MEIKNNVLIKVKKSEITEKFIIPNDVKIIGEGAFQGLKKLRSIVIPSNVRVIEEGAFESCKNLESVSLSDGLEDIEAHAFTSCKSLKEIIIPNTVKSISWGSFSDCESLKKVVLPSNIKHIDSNAFWGCSSLEKIVLPEGIKYIDPYAFSYCKSLKSIIIPNTVKRIGFCAFLGCFSLKNVTLSNNLLILANEAFSQCESLEEIVIPDSVVNISRCAFSDCLNLKKIKFSNNIKQIDGFAFDNCQELKQINIPKSLIYISCYAFNNSNISNLNIRTSLFKFEDSFIENLMQNSIYSLTIYNKKIDLGKKERYDYIDYERIRKNFELTMYDIRKQELLDIIKNELNKNGIIRKRNISYKEHKDIIDDIITNLQYSTSLKHYDYRSVLNPYLEKYIEEHKPKNMLMQLNGNINIFQNKSIDDVIKDLKERKIELLNDNEKYIDIFNYGKGMNEYPLYISSIFYDTVSKYSKDIKIKQIKQVFDKLTSSGKNNLFKKIFFRTNDDNNLVLNKELLEQFNSAIDNEIILASDEIEILNKIKELINNYIGKLQEYISYLNNYSINADNSLDTFSKSDELLKGAVKDSKIQDFNHSITSISEKYGQINLVISNNLIYVNKLNNIKNSLLPTLLERIIIGDAVAKDIEIVKETMQISKMLEEMITNKENISNNLEDNNELDKDKQFVKKNN